MPLFCLFFSLFFICSPILMASPSDQNGGKFASPNTTFIHADPSNFKAIVQKYTGLRREPVIPYRYRLPAPGQSRFLPMGLGPQRPAFKLHERRENARKLEIMLNRGGWSGGDQKVVISPVTPFQFLASLESGSTRSSSPTPTSRQPAPPPLSPLMDEEMRGILEKGFYLHPVCSCKPRESKPPVLLPLFPVNAGEGLFHDGGDDGDRGGEW